ncbi:uncharacterized protein PAC_13851 [Phialocephala subalpina]|uniref:RING-type domain-containing protein n=1 Tax=Phialocephala subalpina TaxID=576137 RepID=A0A1L7XG09_9HELO|nr:uncharacterized protein PAC_13851 [Phialocephala subalpina]
MCRALHTNFFHECGHEQFVYTPALRRACTNRMESRAYEDEFCPRCTWKGKIPFMYPRVYTEPGAGIPCNDRTGEVTRTVRIPWYDRYRYTKETLWAERRRQAKLIYAQQRLRIEQGYDEYKQMPEHQALPPKDEIYVLRASREGVTNPSPEFYRPFADELYLIPENGDTCSICLGRTNLGITHPDACQGSDFVDSTGNKVGGEPVFLPDGHIFGLGCIRLWIEGRDVSEHHDACTFCRHEFNLLREAGFAEDQGWAALYEWDMMSIKGKVLYKLREWNQERISWPDRDNLRRWRIVMIDYYVFVAAAIMALSHPFWFSWTNFLVLTLGAAVYWWERPRPLARESTKRFERYFLVIYFGNLVEWLIENMTRGWFMRWYDFVWTLAYLAGLGLIARVTWEQSQD